MVDGTPEGTRTPDLLLRRQLLYPTELLAHTNDYHILINLTYRLRFPASLMLQTLSAIRSMRLTFLGEQINELNDN